MKRPQLSRRERRVLVAGAAAVAVIIGLTHGWPRWQSWVAESRLAAAELQMELARAQRSLADTSLVRDSLHARAALLAAAAPLVLGGMSASVAGGELTGILSAAAIGAGVRLGSVQLHADSGAHAFRRVSARTEATGDVRGLLQMLARLERGPVWLWVSELSVSQPEPWLDDHSPEALGIRITVTALFPLAAPARPSPGAPDA